MRLTFAWLCVCLAIYCGGHGNVVLSLPPSLIATATEAAALRQQQQRQQQQQQQRWKKDARVLLDSGNDALRDMMHSKASQAANAAGKFTLNDAGNVAVDVDVEQQPQLADYNRKALTLAQAQAQGQQPPHRVQSVPQEIVAQQQQHSLKYATPYKYWATRCQGRAGSAICPREYYRAMLAARNKEALMQMNSMQDRNFNSDSYSDDDDDGDSDLSIETDDMDGEEENNNDVYMLLTGEQDLIKFLNWAMQRLYPYESLGTNLSESSAEFYHPGMFLWKKLNLSGHLEPPLIVEEPHYVLVRREKLLDDYQLGDDILQQENDDPFIPPRGRKHNSPDLDALKNRFDTFMPNRGKRDKLKDLFKNDDLFFPNRGKKHRSNIFQLDDPFFSSRGKKLELRDLLNVNDPFFPNRGKRHLPPAPQPPPLPPVATSIWAKLLPKRKLLDTGNDNWPQRMSTHKINGYDQSVKSSLSTMDAAAALGSIDESATADEGEHWRGHLATGPRLLSNRLHHYTTRSMSEHPQEQQRVRFIANPTMRQQVKSMKTKTTKWPSLSSQRSRETQLTRSLINANLEHDTDIGIDSANSIDTDYGNLVI